MRNVSMVTLGVSDPLLSATFYERLGFARSGKSDENMVWFRTGGTVLALYPRRALAEDIGTDVGGNGFGGIALALNVGSKEEVDRFITLLTYSHD